MLARRFRLGIGVLSGNGGGFLLGRATGVDPRPSDGVDFPMSR